MDRRKPIVGDSTTLEDSLVSKNARFAHDMVNFDVMCAENVLVRTWR